MTWLLLSRNSDVKKCMLRMMSDWGMELKKPTKSWLRKRRRLSGCRCSLLCRKWCISAQSSVVLSLPKWLGQVTLSVCCNAKAATLRSFSTQVLA